jgi:uncharacterized membrane protein
MKKTFYISIVLIISILFVACGAKSPITNKPNNTTSSSNAVSKSNATSNIHKEFSYLPSSNIAMKLLSLTPPSKEKQGYIIAKYIVKNTNNNDVLQNYENVLKKDGWTIYEDKKPYSIAAKKGSHQVALIPSTSGSDVQLTVVSK